MIYGTSWSPGRAFVGFARDFFEAVAREDFQAALGKLDVNDRRWTKQLLLIEIKGVTDGGTICSAMAITKSAKPMLMELENGDFQLLHRLPVDGKWSTASVRFEFVAKHSGNQFSVRLLGFEP